MNVRSYGGVIGRVSRAFTLVEMLVSMAVLALLIVMINEVFSSAAMTTTQGNKHMDADAQARAVFDRMAIDFGQMVKRVDVDYFLKSSGTDQNGNTQPQTGAGATSGSNDQIAFYSQVPGYYPGTSAQSPLSLVAYRVNSNPNSPYWNQLQRFGCGLLWNGASSAYSPMIFSHSPTSLLPNSLSLNWPTATNSTVDDNANYESVGPQVFRMEYYYLVQSGTDFPILSTTPWDKRVAGHASINGLQDVAAISVAIAVIDPKSQMLVSGSQLASLSSAMQDFLPNMHNPGNGPTQTGDLEAQWESAIIGSLPAGIPRTAASSIRIYRRDFYLPKN